MISRPSPDNLKPLHLLFPLGPEYADDDIADDEGIAGAGEVVPEYTANFLVARAVESTVDAVRDALAGNVDVGRNDRGDDALESRRRHPSLQPCPTICPPGWRRYPHGRYC